MSMITINQRYRSATRIDSENIKPFEFIDNYILHGTAINTLETISRDHASKNKQCTYTITGPYGSGKSTIALFLSYLLSTDEDIRLAAENKLKSTDSSLIEISNRFDIVNGWKVIKYVCGLESPIVGILNSVSKQLGKRLSFSPKEKSDNENVRYLKKLLSQIDTSTDGVIILLDELGKALDYLSAKNSDLYVFQELAEIAQNSDNNIIIVGFLHQSFAEYAKNKNTKTQEDWAKIQGRYKDIGFNPSIEESLLLVGEAITVDENIQGSLFSTHAQLINLVHQQFPNTNRASNELSETLPLDPLVSLLLGPITRRRFSQNERSLFGFLASHEKFGFRDFLSNFFNETELYRPENLWNYIWHNLHHVIVTSNDSKAWLECCDAVDRARKIDNELSYEITVLCALYTVFGFHHYLYLSKDFIINYFATRGYDKANTAKTIDVLATQSVLIYRKAYNGYFVFEGSDVDINALVQKEVSMLKGGVDWTKACVSESKFLANGYYQQNGTMRWANKVILSNIDQEFLTRLDKPSCHGISFTSFAIPANDNIKAQLLELASKYPHKVIVGIKNEIERLKEYSIELLALRKILKEEVLIVRDKIAQRELSSRISNMQHLVNEEFELVFRKEHWLVDNELEENTPLSSIASMLAYKIFDKAPSVHNELVNKAKPSGSANSAIKKLLIHMAEHEGEPLLGLPKDTFPAEKGLYYSCIEKYGMYDGQFQLPNLSNNVRVKNLFIETFNKVKKEDRIVSLKIIAGWWSEEPYGLSKGIIQIWLIVFAQIYKKQLAFFEYMDIGQEPNFIDGCDQEFVIRSFTHPQLVAVQYIHIDETTTDYLNRISQPFKGEIDNLSPLEIAQAYVSFVSSLPAYTLNTNEITSELKSFRSFALKASDPNRFILEDIPSVLNKNVSDITSMDVESLVSEFKQVSKKMESQFRKNITEYLPLDNNLYNDCKLVETYTTNSKVEIFASRLSEYSSNNNWVNNIISLLSSKAERNWNDKAIEVANSELTDIVMRFKRDLNLAKFKQINFQEIQNIYRNQITTINTVTDGLSNQDKVAILVTMLKELDHE